MEQIIFHDAMRTTDRRPFNYLSLPALLLLRETSQHPQQPVGRVGIYTRISGMMGGSKIEDE